jgi:hypothetical protein
MLFVWHNQSSPVVETKMSGVEIFKMFESDLSEMHFLRHVESYYCMLRWKNLIRGSFYQKTLSRWHPQWVGRVTGTTPIFLFGLMKHAH